MHMHTAKHCIAGTGLHHTRIFVIFMIEGMATDIKLKDYIMYKYKERIKEKSHYIECYLYQVKIGGAAVLQCLYMSCHCFHNPSISRSLVT